MFGANPGLLVLDVVEVHHEGQVSIEQAPYPNSQLPRPLHISMPPGS